jgi:hypothetical protein
MLNIINMKYEGDKMSPAGFYKQYRSIIINNLAHNRVLKQDNVRR